MTLYNFSNPYSVLPVGDIDITIFDSKGRLIEDVFVLDAAK